MIAVVGPGVVPAEPFQTCETQVRKLTEPLGCEERRLNQVLVESGATRTLRSRTDGRHV